MIDAFYTVQLDVWNQHHGPNGIYTMSFCASLLIFDQYILKSFICFTGGTKTHVQRLKIKTFKFPQKKKIFGKKFRLGSFSSIGMIGNVELWYFIFYEYFSWIFHDEFIQSKKK